MMDTVMYIDENRHEKERKRFLRTGGIVLWLLMIGIVLFLASRSLMG